MRTVESILNKVEKARSEGRWKFGDPTIIDLPMNFEFPTELDEAKFVEGLSCFGHARLILLSRGGKGVGKIFQVEKGEEEWSGGKDVHAYVVLKNAPDDGLALNDSMQWHLTNRQVKQMGEDVTDEIFNSEWNEL